VEPPSVAQGDARAQQGRYGGLGRVHSKVIVLPQRDQHRLHLVEGKLVTDAGAGTAVKGQPGQLVALLSFGGLQGTAGSRTSVACHDGDI